MDGNLAELDAEKFPVITGYDVLRRLGKGGQGTVWLVQAHGGSALLAAKCFAAEPKNALAVEDELVMTSAARYSRHKESQITREWRVLAHYDHDHLVKVHGVLQLERGGQALIMDWAQGGSLQELVAAKGSLSVGETVTVLTPLGQVLSYLHGNGAVHGDISPGNILFTAHGKPVLADLAFSKVIGQKDQDMGGTRGFFCAQDEELSSASDVFAMAAVGWFALTGQVPATTRDRMPLSLYVPDIPKELAAALEAGLCEIAAQRPTAAAFAQAVFRSAQAQAVSLSESAHPSVLPQLLTRRAQRPQRGRGKARKRWNRSKIEAWLLPWGDHTVKRPLIDWRVKRRWLGAAVAVALLGAGFATWNLAVGATKAPEEQSSAAGGGSPVMDQESAGVGAVSKQLPLHIRQGLASQEPEIAIAALAWLRSYTFSNGQFALLDSVNTIGSPAMATDKKIVQALQTSGHSLSGLEISVAGATVTGRELMTGGSETPGSQATVLATVTTSPYTEQDRHGVVVHRREQEQVKQLSIVVMKVGGRWLIQDILPAPSDQVAMIRK